MQDKEQHKIDDLFKKGLDGLPEKTPSSTDWENLKGKMKNEGFAFKVERKSSKFLWPSLLSLLLITAGVSAYYFTNNSQNQNPSPPLKSIHKTDENTNSLISGNADKQTFSEEKADDKVALKELINAASDQSRSKEKVNEGIVKPGIVKKKDRRAILKNSNTINNTEESIVGINISRKKTIGTTSLLSRYSIPIANFEGQVNDPELNAIPNLKSEYFPAENATVFYVGGFKNSEEAISSMENIKQKFNSRIASNDEASQKLLKDANKLVEEELGKLDNEAPPVNQLSGKSAETREMDNSNSLVRIEEGSTTYRVQIGAFKGKVNDTLFSGIKDVKSEFSAEDGLTRFYAGGEFNNKEEAMLVVAKMKENGFEDSFLSRRNYNENQDASAAEETLRPGKLVDLQNETYDSTLTQHAGEKISSDSTGSLTSDMDSISSDSASTLASADTAKKINPITDPAFKKFCIGVYASFDRNYYSIKQGNSSLMGPSFVLNDSIKGEPSWAQYTLGITAGFKISKRIVIETGLFFSQRKKIFFDSGIYKVRPDENADWSRNRCYYKLNAEYLEIFLKTKIYYVEKEKYRLFVSPGVMIESNMIRSKKNSDYYVFESDNNKTILSEKYIFESTSMGTNLSISAGIELKLKENLFFGLEPTYNYGLNQVIRYKNFDMSPVKHYNRSFRFAFRLIKEF